MIASLLALLFIFSDPTNLEFVLTIFPLLKDFWESFLEGLYQLLKKRRKKLRKIARRK
jgi:hypothetical protein